jgi:PAS domain S-box-containing protein
MDVINYYGIGILVVQCILVSSLILSLFRLRSSIGLSLLYATMGLFQYMETFLASSMYVELAKGIIVSPGSCVLFTGTLFAVLLVYIKEDASETRKIVYALILINVVMTGMLYLFGWYSDASLLSNPKSFDIKSTLFLNLNVWILITGAITLFLDSILLIVIYEFFSRKIQNLLLRIWLTMAIVLSFDTLCFVTLNFLNTNPFKSILISGLLSKNGAALIYSILFWLYLKFIDKEVFLTKLPKYKGIFNSLTYRHKFEIAQLEKEVVQKEAKQAIQQSQIKYQTLVGSSPVGVFLTDAEGSTLYVNPQWCIISGMSESEALGWGWLKAVHPNDKKLTEKGWALATEYNESSLSNYRFLHPDGTIRWVLGQAIPEMDADNNLMGYVGTITDITDIKNYEKELHISKEKAEESDRLKTAFLQNISHEIRTPMNAISGFSELLRNADLSEEKRESYISIIQRSGNQLLSIVSDILTISSLETNQESLTLTKVNINALMADLQIEFKEQADKKNLMLLTKLPLNDNQAETEADLTKLTQILTNLLTNALKFTHSGVIEFGYRFNAKEFEFFVRDTGIGIRAEALENIFGRFCQADKTIQGNYGGTGLGLSISRGFVELMGGKIWVNSTYGKGTTFYFTLPVPSNS